MGDYWWTEGRGTTRLCPTACSSREAQSRHIKIINFHRNSSTHRTPANIRSFFLKTNSPYFFSILSYFVSSDLKVIYLGYRSDITSLRIISPPRCADYHSEARCLVVTGVPRITYMYNNKAGPLIFFFQVMQLEWSLFLLLTDDLFSQNDRHEYTGERIYFTENDKAIVNPFFLVSVLIFWVFAYSMQLIMHDLIKLNILVAVIGYPKLFQ